MAKLIGNLIIKGKIKTLTGLHIGGSSDSLQIGGVDSPVLRDPRTRHPYIPGSSLKGKMRMLTEFSLGLAHEGGPALDPTQLPAQIYGTSEENAQIGPTRLTVRDAYPDKETKEMWNALDSDLKFTEVKGENTIDRITSKANPRFLERVVPNSRFDFEMIYSFYDLGPEAQDIQVDDLNNLKEVFKSLALLEHSSIGGNGSRGYGKIQFLLQPVQFFVTDDYRNAVAVLQDSAELTPLSEFDLDAATKVIKSKLS